MTEKLTNFPISIDIGGTLSKICIFLDKDTEIPSFLSSDLKASPNIKYLGDKTGDLKILNHKKK
jgi:hypothetical protein